MRPKRFTPTSLETKEKVVRLAGEGANNIIPYPHTLPHPSPPSSKRSKISCKQEVGLEGLLSGDVEKILLLGPVRTFYE